ncbi:PREDICTED: trypsin-4-like, partial [Rhagoletis zephyria]|uniref:trypsin-4-like n=1 Tax=Rhagoletis zephyria TaxID=28612 RepID=UPI0008112DB1
SLECGEFYSVHHHHLHHASESADNEQHHEDSILETRIVNGELASLGEFPWQISMQRRVRPKVAAAAGSGSANKTASPPAAALPGIASTKPETPSSSPPPPPALPSQPPVPQDPVEKVQNTSSASSSSNEANLITEDEILDESLWGSLDWRNLDQSQRSSAQVISVDRIVVHPGWSQASGQNDVALLHLQTPLEFTRDADNAKVVTVNKVCLSRSAEGEHSGMATSSGWGFLHKDQRVSPDLMRRVDIPVVDHATCRSAFSRVIGVTQMQVCAGQAPKGNCMGDSGGPLVQKSSKGGSGRATQIGIVSFSIPCAVPGYPDVFTRVAKYLDWISQNSGIPF